MKHLTAFVLLLFATALAGCGKGLLFRRPELELGRQNGNRIIQPGQPSMYANLGIANGDPSVTLYAQGTKSLLRAVTKNISNPRALSFNSVGHLYVANQGHSRVTIYGSRGNDIWARLQEASVIHKR